MTLYLESEPAVAGTSLVRAAKNDPALTRILMEATMRRFVADDPWPDWRPGVVVPCPSSRERTFPRSVVLGEAAAGVLGVPMQDILVRTDGHGPRSSQSRKTPASTLHALLERVKVQAIGVLPHGTRVLLVDDTCTLGETAASSAYALRNAGAADVRLVTFAKYETRDHLEKYCD